MVKSQWSRGQNDETAGQVTRMKNLAPLSVYWGIFIVAIELFRHPSSEN